MMEAFSPVRPLSRTERQRQHPVTASRPVRVRAQSVRSQELGAAQRRSGMAAISADLFARSVPG